MYNYNFYSKLLVGISVIAILILLAFVLYTGYKYALKEDIENIKRTRQLKRIKSK